MSLALVFSPQGSQAIGMGRELTEASPAARAVFESADDVLGWSVTELAWNGPQQRLNDTRWTQPCLLATSIAALRGLEEAAGSLHPAYVAGHSVGEYAALVAAGVLELGDALRLVARRGELMADLQVEGGMLAIIGLDRDTVARALEIVAGPADLVVANDNAPGQQVISGTRDALTAAEPALRAAGARRVIRLPVSGPFHSPWMADVTDALADAFRSVAWSDADPPVVSNVTAEPVTDATTIRNLLAEQVRSPVEWVASVQRMARDGVDTFVECGSGDALVGMIRRIVPGARALSVSDRPSLQATVQAVGGVPAEASA